jgi:hypothetical protein
MKRDLDFCEGCGDRPATQQRPGGREPNVYCDVCAARRTAEDGGVVYAAVQMMTYAMGPLHEHVVDPAETRRIVDCVLGDVLDGQVDLGTQDVGAFKLRESFRPIQQAA